MGQIPRMEIGEMPEIKMNRDGTYHSVSKHKTEFSGFPDAKNVYNNKPRTKHKTEFSGFPDPKNVYNGRSKPETKHKTEFSGFPDAKNVYNGRDEKHDGNSLGIGDKEEIAIDLRRVILWMMEHNHQSSRWGSGIPFFKTEKAKTLYHTYTPSQQREMYKIGNAVENGLDGFKMGKMPSNQQLESLAVRVLRASNESDREDRRKKEEAEKLKNYKGPMWSVNTNKRKPTKNFFPY